MSHGALEDQLNTEGRGLIRQLFQDHLTLRAQTEQAEPRLDVTGADGVRRGRVEPGHARELLTVFGTVQVNRLAYRAPQQPNLHPADAALNLPTERQSHGNQAACGGRGGRGSFDETQLAIGRATGQKVGKRQLEQLADRAAVDFEAYYAKRLPPEGQPGDLLVLSCDGKGIVMRPGALRPQTAKAAAKASPKLKTRLSKGERATVNGWLRSGPSTTPPPQCGPSRTSCPAATPSVTPPQQVPPPPTSG